MTSPVEHMRQHWAILSRGEDPLEHEKLYTLLIESGIKPTEFAVYGAFRAFLKSQGLSEMEPLAFHNGRCIGTHDEVAKYLGVTCETSAG